MQLSNGILAPGICFICEQTPQPGDEFVDTLRNYEPDVFTHLEGRKYLCKECALAAAEAFGAFDMLRKTVADQTVALDASRGELDAFKRDSVTEFFELMKRGELQRIIEPKPVGGSKPGGARKPRSTVAAPTDAGLTLGH